MFTVSCYEANWLTSNSKCRRELTSSSESAILLSASSDCSLKIGTLQNIVRNRLCSGRRIYYNNFHRLVSETGNVDISMI